MVQRTTDLLNRHQSEQLSAVCDLMHLRIVTIVAVSFKCIEIFNAIRLYFINASGDGVVGFTKYLHFVIASSDVIRVHVSIVENEYTFITRSCWSA